MNSGLFFGNKKYISIREASLLTGYSSDHVSKLCRLEELDAKRVGQSWYVSESSIVRYKNSFEKTSNLNVEDGYVSVRQANQITGYSKDYISRLCRQGLVDSKMIARAWFVSPESLINYKNTPVEFDYSKNLSGKQSLVKEDDVKDLTYDISFIQKKKLPTFPELFHRYIFYFDPNFAKVLAPLSIALLLVIGTFSLRDTAISNMSNEASAISSFTSPLQNTSSLIYSSINSIIDKAIYSPFQKIFGNNTLVATPDYVIQPRKEKPPVILTQGTTNTLPKTVPQPIIGSIRSTGSRSSLRDMAQTSESKTVQASSPQAAIIQKTTERVIVGDVTKSYVDLSIQQLQNKFSSDLSRLTSGGGGAVTNIYQQIAHTQRIDNLYNTAISNPSITGGTLSGGSITNTNISATSLSATSATLTSVSTPSLTLSGASKNSLLSLDSNGLVVSTSTPTFASLNATSTSAISTFAGRISANFIPSAAHTFPAWIPGSSNSNYDNASLLINPVSAIADSNLFALAVNGSVKLLADAEGDLFVNSLTSVGSVTLSTTSASTFSVEGNTTLGDAITDVTTINGTLNVTGTTTSSTVAGNFGIGSSSPTYKLTVTGSGFFDGGTVSASSFVATSSFTAPSFRITGQAVNSLLSTNSSGEIVATSTPTFGNFNATSTTATSTIAGFLDVLGTGTNATSTFSSNLWVKGGLRIGTGSLYLDNTSLSASNGGFSLSSTATSTFSTNGLTVGTSQFVVQQNSGNVGVGDATPSNILDVTGTIGISDVTVIDALRNLTNIGTISSGAITSGLINDQTISSAASFTGTLNAASTITGSSFSGAGTGLTGTAASLSIGGNAATASVAPAGTLTGTTLASNVVTSSLTSVGTLGSLAVSGTVTGGTYNGQTISSAANFTGTLNVASTITGSSFSGAGTGLTGTAASLTAGAIVSQGTLATLNAAPAGTLTGTTLASNVVTSSLTSVGTLGSLAVSGTVTGGTYNGQTISSAASFTGTLNAASTITGSSFSGAGTGLTGTAASLSIGGNAATATNVACSGVTGNGVGCSDVYINTSGDTMSGDLNFNNYGIGIVGTYSDVRYQNVFSMGASYTPADNGTSLDNMYGIAWTHSNIGGQSKAGLGHQALFVQAGATTAAIGTGIWTSGVITGTSNLTISGSGSVGSTFSAGTSISTPDVYASSWFRNDGAGEGLYNSGTGKHFYSENASYWAMDSVNGMIFRNGHGGTAQGYVYNDATGFGLLNNQGNWMLYSADNSQTVTFPGAINSGAITASGAITTASNSGLTINGQQLVNSSNFTYGSFGLVNTKNGYYGINFGNTDSLGNLMYDTSGNGGLYYASLGRWRDYYIPSSNTWNINTSSNLGYNLGVSGTFGATGSVTVGGRAWINGGSTAYPFSVGGSSGEWTAYVNNNSVSAYGLLANGSTYALYGQGPIYGTGTITAGGSFSGPGTGLTGTASSLTAGAANNVTSTIGGLRIAHYNRGDPYGNDGQYTAYDTGAMGRNLQGPNEVFTNGRSGFIDVWGGSGYPSGLSHMQGFQAMHYSGGYGIQLAAQYNDDTLYVRQATGGTLRGWRKILETGNYSGYSTFSGTVTAASASYIGSPQSLTVEHGALNPGEVMVKINLNDSSVGNEFFLQMLSANSGDNEFLFATDGQGYSDQAWTTPADVAEWTRVVGDPSTYQPGELVAFSSADRRAQKASVDNPAIAGVITVKPGLVGFSYDFGLDVTEGATGPNNKFLEEKFNAKIVATIGYTPIKISTETGPIEAGDGITVSSVDGVGRKAKPGEQIVGYAYEAFDPTNGKMGTHNVDVPSQLEGEPFHPMTTSVTFPDGETGYQGWVLGYVNMGVMPYPRGNFSIDDTGNVGIGGFDGLTASTSPQYKLHVLGDIAGTSFVNISTRDSKKDIEYITEESKSLILDTIGDIKIAKYRYNQEDESAPLRLGLIADEVPIEILSVNGKGVDIYKLATFTLAGVQELSTKVIDMETRISNLENATSTGLVSNMNISLATVTDYLASVGMSFVNGVTNIVSLAVENLKVGSAEKPSGITLYDEVTSEPYCLKMRNGAMVSVAGECYVATSTPSNIGNTGTTTPQSDTSLPVITLLGDFPATITVGTSYVDLGATVSDTNADGSVNNNLGLYFNVNGTDMAQVTIDTTATSTHTIIYSAIDAAGNTGTATRIVNVVE